MKLTTREFIRSTVFAFLSTIIAAVIASLNAGNFPTWPELKVALIAGAATLLGAILKYMSTDTVASAKKDIATQVPEGGQIVVKGEKEIK